MLLQATYTPGGNDMGAPLMDNSQHQSGFLGGLAKAYLTGGIGGALGGGGGGAMGGGGGAAGGGGTAPLGGGGAGDALGGSGVAMGGGGGGGQGLLGSLLGSGGGQQPAMQQPQMEHLAARVPQNNAPSGPNFFSYRNQGGQPNMNGGGQSMGGGMMQGLVDDGRNYANQIGNFFR